MSKIMDGISRIFRSNKFIVIMSFLASISLWFYVSGVYSPLSTKNFNSIQLSLTITGSVPESHNLMITKDKPITVNVTVEGPRSSLAILQSSSIKLKLDYNSIKEEGNYNIPILVELPSADLKAVNVYPKDINLDFYKKTTSSVDVKINVMGTVKEGFIADTPKAYPSSLNLSGPESKIKAIKNVLSLIDVTNASETVLKKADFVFIDEKGQAIDGEGITADFTQITVTAPILKSKTVPLSVNIINSSGGANSKFISVAIQPQSIIIAGSPELIDSTNFVDLGTIDVAEISKDGKKSELDIISPNGLKVFDATTKAVITLTYPEIVSKTIDVKNFSFTNLLSGKKATPVSSTVRVTVIGVPADINALKAEDITVVVDMTDITAVGKVQFNLTFTFPTEAKVGVSGKYTALVNVR